MKIKIKKLCFVLFSLMITLCISSCNWFSGGDDGKIHESPLSEYTEKKQDYTYFSDQAPGKWKDQATDHMPVYTVTKSKDKKFWLINVTMPFKGTVSPPHYFECIILTDHNGKEMQKTTFDRGSQIFETRFMLPIDYKAYVYIIAKCNLHDMWRVKVFPGNR